MTRLDFGNTLLSRIHKIAYILLDSLSPCRKLLNISPCDKFIVAMQLFLLQTVLNESKGAERIYFLIHKSVETVLIGLGDRKILDYLRKSLLLLLCLLHKRKQFPRA